MRIYLSLLLIIKHSAASVLSLVDRDVVIDSLVMVVNGYRQRLLGDVLAYDVLVEVLVNFLRRRRRFTIRPSSKSGLRRSELRVSLSAYRLLGVVLWQNDEKVTALITFDEPSGRNEFVDVFTRGSTFGANLKTKRNKFLRTIKVIRQFRKSLNNWENSGICRNLRHFRQCLGNWRNQSNQTYFNN